MAPTAVLDDSATTRTTMTTASHNTQSIPARSDDPHGFGIYQSTILDAVDKTIHTLVTVLISTPHIVNISSLRYYFATTSSSTLYIFFLIKRQPFTYYVVSLFIILRRYNIGFLHSEVKSVIISDTSNIPSDISSFLSLYLSSPCQ